jgi:hypothetical protein
MPRRKKLLPRIYTRGGVLERMLAKRKVEGPNSRTACWRWLGAHSQKVRKGRVVGPPRPVVWLGPDQDSPVLPVARVALSFYDGVELDQREDLEAGHVKCTNAWCWNPRHLAWRTKAENREDRLKQYGSAWGRIK